MKKWYHISSIIYNSGNELEFNPNIPYYLQKGEDRRNPRVCVTANWRHSLRSIILIRRSKSFFVYSTLEQPINPTKERENRIKNKQIRKNSNDFRLPPDGFINKEHWFLKPVTMKLEGVVKIPKKEYLSMLMDFGFSGEQDINKLKIVTYKEKTIAEMLKRC